MGADQQIIATASGPACHSRAILGFIVARTHRTWVTTSTAGFGLLMGELDRAGTDVDIWQDGPAAEDVAQALTASFAEAGWHVEWGAYLDRDQHPAR